MIKGSAKKKLDKNLISINDQDRIQALHSYQILDTPNEEAFDNIAHIIADDLDVPVALIFFVDKDKVFIKSNAGIPCVRYIDRDRSFCSSTVLSDAPTILKDTINENCLISKALFANKFNAGHYAGAPIITPEGHNIGTVCVLNEGTQKFSKKQEQKLVRYSNLVMHELTNRLFINQTTGKIAKEKKLRKKQISLAVIKAQKYERSQIGLELHDNISQILTTVRLYNELALSGIGDVNALLEMSTKYLYKCIEEIRSLSQNMCAPSLKGITLADLIKDLVESINRTKKTFVNYIITGLNDNFAEHDLHLVVYRVVQEQLNNIIKHAEASYVTIELYNSTNGFQLLITDNGKGFDLSRKRAGIGLKNMRTRIEKLSGIFTINSSIGKGCQLHVDFPSLA